MAYDHYEMSLAAGSALFRQFGQRFAISKENVPFNPPAGAEWLRFNYIEADTQFVSLNRKCKVYLGIVQIDVVFQPGEGINYFRGIAKEIADFFEDGKMLDVGYISQGATVHPVQKSETGWFIPVRYTLRVD